MDRRNKNNVKERGGSRHPRRLKLIHAVLLSIIRYVQHRLIKHELGRWQVKNFVVRRGGSKLVSIARRTCRKSKAPEKTGALHKLRQSKRLLARASVVECGCPSMSFCRFSFGGTPSPTFLNRTPVALA